MISMPSLSAISFLLNALITITIHCWFLGLNAAKVENPYVPPLCQYKSVLPDCSSVCQPFAMAIWLFTLAVLVSTIILPENKTRVLVKKIPNLTITNEKANTPQIRTFLQGQSST